MRSDGVAEGSLPARWVTCDEGYSRSVDFLDGVVALSLGYMAKVPVNTRLWPERPPTVVPHTQTRLAPGAPAPSRHGRWQHNCPRTTGRGIGYRRIAEAPSMPTSPCSGASRHAKKQPGLKLYQVAGCAGPVSQPAVGRTRHARRRLVEQPP